MSFSVLSKISISIFLIVLTAIFSKDIEHKLLEMKIALASYEIKMIDLEIQKMIKDKNAKVPKNSEAFMKIVTKHFSNASIRNYTKDQWGEKLQYLVLQKNGYSIVSSGPDKILNTDDDLVLERKLGKQNLMASQTDFVLKKVEDARNRSNVQKQSMKHKVSSYQEKCKVLIEEMKPDEKIYFVDALSNIK
jgi:hypothetical protein